MWTREGKLVGEIDRQDQESTFERAGDTRVYPVLTHRTLVGKRRSGRAAAHSQQPAGGRLGIVTAYARPRGHPLGPCATDAWRICARPTPVVYNVSTFSLHKPLSSLSERIHREAVRCLAHVSGT